MIEITNDFRSKYASVVRKSRTEKIRVVRLEVDLYYVARREKGHGRYFVKLVTDEEGKVTAECRFVNGWRCQGTMKRGSCCTHIAAAIERGIQLGRKKERKQAA